MSRKFLFIATLLFLSGMLVSGCSPNVPASEVTFDVSIIEIKGATDGIEPPQVDPTSLSSGYRFKPPGEYDESNPDKWQVSTYLFSPSDLTVKQGDSVTLRMFVVNGDTHVTWLEAPDGSKVDEFTPDNASTNPGNALINLKQYPLFPRENPSLVQVEGFSENITGV